MNALKRKINSMNKKDAQQWFYSIYPNSSIKRKSAMYRDIIKKSNK